MRPKVYAMFDKDSTMHISVKIFANLIENEEDFYATLPPSLRGYETPTDEIETLARGNYDPDDYLRMVKKVNLI